MSPSECLNEGPCFGALSVSVLKHGEKDAILTRK